MYKQWIVTKDYYDDLGEAYGPFESLKAAETYATERNNLDRRWFYVVRELRKP